MKLILCMARPVSPTVPYRFVASHSTAWMFAGVSLPLEPPHSLRHAPVHPCFLAPSLLLAVPSPTCTVLRVLWSVRGIPPGKQCPPFGRQAAAKGGKARTRNEPQQRVATRTMAAMDGSAHDVMQGMTRALDMIRGGKVDWDMIWDAMADCEPSKLKEVSHQFWKDAMKELSTRIVEALQSVLEPGSNEKCMSVSPSWYTAWKTMQLICSACNSEEEKEELRQISMHSWKALFEMLAAETMNAPLARNRSIQKHVKELLRIACAWPSLLERADIVVVLGVLRLAIYHHLSSKESHENELHMVLEMLYFCIRRGGVWFQREVILSMVAAVEAIVDAKEYHQSTFPSLCASVYSYVHSLDKEEGSLQASVELLESMVNFLVEKVGDAQITSSKVFLLLLNGGIAANFWDSLVQRLTDRRLLSQLSTQVAKKKLQTCFLVLQGIRDKSVRARGAHRLIQLLRDDVPSPFEIRVDVLKNLSTLCNNLEQESWDVAVRHILQVLLYNPSIRVRRAAMSTCEFVLEQPQLSTASQDIITEILQVMFLKARDKDKDIRRAAMQSFRHGFSDENTYTPTEQLFKIYCSKKRLVEGLEALGMLEMWEVLRGPLQNTLTPTQLVQAFTLPSP